jgi:ABC-2 type transport system permease protein
MRALDPPGTPWLLRHELRLGWRALGSARRVFAALALLGWLGFHMPAWFIMSRASPGRWVAIGAPFAIAASAFVILLLLSTAFGLAVRAVYDRGDLDLLGSAPIPPANVYAVRAAYVGVASVTFVFLFWAPFMHAGALLGRPSLLLGYPVILAIGLACASLALAGTLALARAVGVSRARVLAQVLGALVGAAFVLVSQAQVLLPVSVRGALAEWATRGAGHAWLTPASPLAWPARAVLGEPGPALAVIVAGVALFALIVTSTQRGFIEAAQRSNEVPAPKRARGPTVVAARTFASGLARIVIGKELKLIARDPLLIAKSLLQVLYLIPLLVIMARKTAPALVAAPALVLIVSNLAASLTWIAVSAEEAPDLVNAAPVSAARVALYKVCAALLLPAALSVPFVIGYGFESVFGAAVVAISVAGAALTSAAIETWTGKPAPMKNLSARHKDNVVVGMAEAFSGMAWGFACYLALKLSPFAPLPLLMPAGTLLLAWMVRRRER